MDKLVALKTALQAQKELRMSAPQRTEAALLREVFVQVEEALAAGYTREVVFHALKETGGYTLLWGGFKMAVQRIRAQRLRGGQMPISRVATSVRPVDVHDSAEAESSNAQSGLSPREVVANSRAGAEDKFNQYSRQAKRLGVLKRES